MNIQELLKENQLLREQNEKLIKELEETKQKISENVKLRIGEKNPFLGNIIQKKQ